MTPYVDTVPAHPHGIMLHHLHGAGHGVRQGSVTAEDFEALVDHVSRSATLLGARDWQERAITRTLEPHDVCLTFDDGLRCQRDLAVPVLERRGWTAFFFVHTTALEGTLDPLELYAHLRHTCYDSMDDFYRAFEAAVDSTEHGPRARRALARFEPAAYLVDAPFYTDGDRRFRYLRDCLLGPEAYTEIMERMIDEHEIDRESLAAALAMTTEDLRWLQARGHVVGLHSHSHPTDVCTLSAHQQRWEYETCQTRLTAVLGAAPTCMAHPCGRYDETTLAVLRQLGVNLGFRADFAQTSGTRLEHPRQDHANIVRVMASSDS